MGVQRVGHDLETEQPPKARRSKEEFYSRASGGRLALLMPCFQTSSLQTCERINFCYYKSPSLWPVILNQLVF